MDLNLVRTFISFPRRVKLVYILAFMIGLEGDFLSTFFYRQDVESSPRASSIITYCNEHEATN